MRTAIVSDLHLGSSNGDDLLRDGEIRRILLEEISGADRLVLLGDAIELRELPLAATLEAARPFFVELGEAMAGAEIVLVPGNHDHRLAGSLLEELAFDSGGQLGLEQCLAPAGEAASRIAAWLGPATLAIAYPGIWLREDVYATHGHYMDCHMSLPRVECLAAAAVARVLGPIPDPAAPEDYERILAPIYGLSDGFVQGGIGRSRAGRRASPSESAWRRISAGDRHRGRFRRLATRTAFGAGIRSSVWGLNRLLRAEFEADISVAAITRSGIEAALEMERRLETGAAHLITGHTHRAGPGTEEGPWSLSGGGQLHNTGCWTFTSAFHRPGTPPGPYWPGTLTWVETDRPPRRVRLLDQLSREALRAKVRTLANSIK